MKLLLFLILTLSLTLICHAATTYDDLKVYSVTPTTEEQLTALRDLSLTSSLSNRGYDFWTEPRAIGYPVHIMINRTFNNTFNWSRFRQENHLQATVIMEDVRKAVEASSIDTKDTTFDFKNYHKLETIHDHLHSLEEKYPNVHVVDIGKSFENRPLLGAKITFAEGNPNIIFEGGIHAREWISPATTMYIMQAVLDKAETEPILKKYNYHFFPVTNPDGYVYTYTFNLNDAQYRFWRKSRQPSGSCIGTDLNRNWAYNWGGPGASSDPCSDTYAGANAYSAPETNLLHDYIQSVPEIDGYFSMHSYSQLILIPYASLTAGKPDIPDDFDRMEIIAKAAVETLASYGTTYKEGNTAAKLYEAAGGSDDTVKKERNPRMCYTYELRPSDKLNLPVVGIVGFVLPANQIEPTGIETFAAILTMFKTDQQLP